MSDENMEVLKRRNIDSLRDGNNEIIKGPTSQNSRVEIDGKVTL
jgi:hypothetical protein